MGSRTFPIKKKLFADNREKEEDMGLFYLTLRPEQAVDASRQIRAYADENGFEKKYSYRIALCLEEMAAYAVSSQGRDDINIQLVIRLRENRALFMMLDDGKCIALDKKVATRKLVDDNYELLKKVAKSVEYQYILNMNYTILTF